MFRRFAMTAESYSSLVNYCNKINANVTATVRRNAHCSYRHKPFGTVDARPKTAQRKDRTIFKRCRNYRSKTAAENYREFREISVVTVSRSTVHVDFSELT